MLHIQLLFFQLFYQGIGSFLTSVSRETKLSTRENAHRYGIERKPRDLNGMPGTFAGWSLRQARVGVLPMPEYDFGAFVNDSQCMMIPHDTCGNAVDRFGKQCRVSFHNCGYDQPAWVLDCDTSRSFLGFHYRYDRPDSLPCMN